MKQLDETTRHHIEQAAYTGRCLGGVLTPNKAMPSRSDRWKASDKSVTVVPDGERKAMNATQATAESNGVSIKKTAIARAYCANAARPM